MKLFFFLIILGLEISADEGSSDVLIGARALSYKDRKFETKVMNLSCFTGFLKCWESSIDLVNVLKHEIRDGQLSFRGKRVLEVIQ